MLEKFLENKVGPPIKSLLGRIKADGCNLNELLNDVPLPFSNFCDPLQDANRQVIEWGEATFPNMDIVGIGNHLMEEAAELVHAIKKWQKDPVKNWEELRHEIADVQVLFIQILSILGVSDSKSLAEIVLEKLEILKKREWNPPDENGVIHRKKSETVGHG